jgi:hypothetical protein
MGLSFSCYFHFS